MGATNPQWKRFEREVAALFGGRRFWSNSGEQIDVESSTVVAQCKNVRECTLTEQGEQRLKAGVVALRAKRKAGRGRRRPPTLIVMTETTWRALHGAPAE